MPQFLGEHSHILSTVIRHEGHPYVHFNGQVPLTPHWLADSWGSYCSHKQTHCYGKRHFIKISHQGLGSFTTGLLLSNGLTQLLIVSKSNSGSRISIRFNHLMRWSLCNVTENVSLDSLYTDHIKTTVPWRHLGYAAATPATLGEREAVLNSRLVAVDWWLWGASWAPGRDLIRVPPNASPERSAGHIHLGEDPEVGLGLVATIL